VVVCPACTVVDWLGDVVVAVREPLVPVTTAVDDAVVPAAVVCVVSVPDALVDVAPVVGPAALVVGPAALVVADEDGSARPVVVTGAAVLVTAGAAEVVTGAAVVVIGAAGVVTAGAAVVVITGGAVVVITGGGASWVGGGASWVGGGTYVGSGAGAGGGGGGGASRVGGGASRVGSCCCVGAGAYVVVVTGAARAGPMPPLSAVNEMASPEARTTATCRPRQIRSVAVIVATLSPRPWRVE
jgi:hypothetical protein